MAIPREDLIRFLEEMRRRQRVRQRHPPNRINGPIDLLFYWLLFTCLVYFSREVVYQEFSLLGEVYQCLVDCWNLWTAMEKENQKDLLADYSFLHFLVTPSSTKMSSGAPKLPTEDVEGEDDDVGFMYEGLVRCLTSQEVEEDRRRDVSRREKEKTRQQKLKAQDPRSEMEHPVVEQIVMEQPVMPMEVHQVQVIVAEEEEEEDEFIDVGSRPPMPDDYLPTYNALLERERLRKEESTTSFANENPANLQALLDPRAEGQPAPVDESAWLNPGERATSSSISSTFPPYTPPMWNYFTALSMGYAALPTVVIPPVLVTWGNYQGQVFGIEPLVANTVPDQEAPVDLSRQAGQNDTEGSGRHEVLVDVVEDVGQNDLQRLRLTSWLFDGYKGVGEAEENGMLTEAEAVDDKNEDAVDVAPMLQKAPMDLKDVQRDASFEELKEIIEDAPGDARAAEDSSSKRLKESFENVEVKALDEGIKKTLEDVRGKSSEAPPKEVTEDVPEATEYEESGTLKDTNPAALIVAAPHIEEPEPQPGPAPPEQLQGILAVRMGQIRADRVRPKGRTSKEQ
ncbi:unnamed protein product [Caenorhabditis nigoni]